MTCWSAASANELTANLLLMTLDDVNQNKSQQNQAGHVQNDPQLRPRQASLQTEAGVSNKLNILNATWEPSTKGSQIFTNQYNTTNCVHIWMLHTHTFVTEKRRSARQDVLATCRYAKRTLWSQSHYPSLESLVQVTAGITGGVTGGVTSSLLRR